MVRSFALEVPIPFRFLLVAPSQTCLEAIQLSPLHKKKVHNNYYSSSWIHNQQLLPSLWRLSKMLPKYPSVGQETYIQQLEGS